MKNNRLDPKPGRRGFLATSLKSVGAAVAGLVLAPRNAALALAGADQAAISHPVLRTLGKTGLRLPIIGMGAVNTLNGDLVRAALDRGIVYFDTGHYYQRGRNEIMLGEVLKGRPRDSFVLATKVMGEHEDQVRGAFPRDGAWIKRFVEKFEVSLKRLGLQYADIFLLHGAGSRETTLFEPLISAMDKLKSEGKTRWLGVSTHINEPEVIRAAAASGAYDVVMTAYNFRQPHRREVEAAIAEAARAGLGVIAMKTQAGVFWDAARQVPINMTAALKWSLANRSVHMAVPGFTTFDQLETDLSVMRDPELSPDEIKDLERGGTEGLVGLYCAQCGSCRKGCPRGLDIAALMRSYMYAYGYRNYSEARRVLIPLGDAELSCADCPACTAVCAQGFDLKERILDIEWIRRVPSDRLG